MLYFRRIEHKHAEWFATNSSGNFAALCRKLDDDDDSSWAVFSGPEDVKPDATGLTLEHATDFMLANFAFDEPDKKKVDAKKAKRDKTRADRLS